ncbi:MAG: S8 family serine peptidase [Chloroflexi bacterium]|nr:S8 family serine peptidase [Chloroflexota bacterium]
MSDVTDFERPSGGNPKLESSLNQLLEAYRREGLAKAQAFAETHMMVLDDDRVQVVIETTQEAMSDLKETIEALGGEYQTRYETLLQALVPIDALESLAGRPDVQRVREPRRPMPAAPMQVGDQTTEGVAASNASAWHGGGYTGSGVRIAVIDGGFTDYASLLGNDLPASVTTYDWTGTGMGGSPHGTACAEIVYDMAPGATMDLHKIGTGVELGNAVDQAIADGVDIISMSLVWLLDGPGDGTGFLANIVSDARSNGIFYAAAAGNSAEHSWSGTYNDSGNEIHLWAPGQDINYFGPGDGDAWIIPSGFPIQVFLHWDDWTALNQDYDMELYYWDDDSWEYVTGSYNDQPGGYPTPEEGIVVDAPFEGVYGVVVWRYSATLDVCLRLNASHSGYDLDERTPERSVMFPADSPDAITVGAVDVSSPYPLEPYSSRGPTFGPGGSCSGGSTKPDIAAYANVSTVSYGAEGFNGTSAATPHVAGAAALVKEAYPTYTVSQLQSYLENEAIDLGAAGKDNLYGAGRLYLGDPPQENNPPNTPSNTSPADGATGISLTPTLQSSAFSDPDAGDTHAASQWQVTTTPGDYSTPIFDSGTDTLHLTSIAIPSGTLSHDTTYGWHVRHRDNHGAWSLYSAETSFTTRTEAVTALRVNVMPEYYTFVGTGNIIWGNCHWDPDDTDHTGSYHWDFGDGDSADGAVSDTAGWDHARYIDETHTYDSAGVYDASLTVTADFDGSSDSDTVRIHVYDEATLTPDELEEVKVNKAIEDGLRWLYNRQYTDGKWRGYNGYYIAGTGEAALAFENQGHLPSNDINEDIYAEYIQMGLDYLLGQLSVQDLTNQTYIGNPDTNGNGIGLYWSGDRCPYFTPMGMMAIIGSLTPDEVATTGDATYVNGRTYRNIVRDVCDWLAWAQNEAGGGVHRGGWRYSANYATSDNSVSQWPALGLFEAEKRWSITAAVYELVKEELELFLNNTQVASGGFDYYPDYNWVNIAKTGAGIIMLNYIDATTSDTRVIKATEYLHDTWDVNNNDPGWRIKPYGTGSFYAMYAVYKGCKDAKPSEIEKLPLPAGTRDWYADFVDYLLNTQNADGSWPSGKYGDDDLDTMWAILILSPAVLGGPMADAGPPQNVCVNEAVTFDGSGSSHTTGLELTEYLWDFDASNGVDWGSPDDSGKVVNYAGYPVPGDYTVTLRVKDELGNTDTDTAIVHVEPCDGATVYFEPQHSSASFCHTTEVEIRVDAADFQGGQIKLTYNSACADVTNWERNRDDFAYGTWESGTPGEEWITFSAEELLTGEYLIGTLTIHGVSEEECTTALDFVAPSALKDNLGNEVPATWTDGTFECIVGMCGDVAPSAECDGEIDVGDFILLLNYVGHPGDYHLCCEAAPSTTAAPAVPTAAENEVNFFPQESSAPFCETTEVQIWVDATNFQGGQIKFTYDSTCADVTNWERNRDDFAYGTWESGTAGEEWILFSAEELLTGEYLIGTLTIHGVSEEECTTALDFVAPSALKDNLGNEILATWTDGTFRSVTMYKVYLPLTMKNYD